MALVLAVLLTLMDISIKYIVSSFAQLHLFPAGWGFKNISKGVTNLAVWWALCLNIFGESDSNN